MTWTDPTTFTAGAVLTAAQLNTYTQNNLTAIAEWTSYAPTVTQSGTVSHTDTYAKYKSYGGSCEVQCLLTMSGAGTATNNVTVSLPVTAATSSQNFTVGYGFISDVSINTVYPVLVRLISTTTVNFMRTDTNPSNQWGNDPNTALASSDIISFTAIIPVA